MGWGIGALFERKNRWVDEKQMFMVESIDWERWNDSDLVTLVGLSIANASGSDTDWRKPRQVNVTFALHPEAGDIKMPLVPRHLEQKAPEVFLTELCLTKVVFPKGQSRKYIHERIEETGRL